MFGFFGGVLGGGGFGYFIGVFLLGSFFCWWGFLCLFFHILCLQRIVMFCDEIILFMESLLLNIHYYT